LVRVREVLVLVAVSFAVEVAAAGPRRRTCRPRGGRQLVAVREGLLVVQGLGPAGRRVGRVAVPGVLVLDGLPGGPVVGPGVLALGGLLVLGPGVLLVLGPGVLLVHWPGALGLDGLRVLGPGV